MNKISKIILSVLWALTAISTLGVGAYVLADVNTACQWAWFLPAIVAFVSSVATVIAKAVSTSKKAHQAKIATKA
ncbi:hypothetical protein [Malacoplasma iowae]|uniref:Uncharacterized protein n=2 Tax=Malacoplasma iowae TaxID=2116 RepID=A0A084U3P4_MALIO|nr:hypothetical protein [Malacoplasma iowae]VEU61813.1 Uncharacterised protein [Mycoplasmopsis fermentans]EGZ30846.1 hypothetical protein GUU_04881 [Malacoplasma iowae 695]KFB07580.1 hypothetical protein P271_425 [Malacoplasma iowae DK-CPA]QHG90111.1 hypothetical protein EER00_04470 [Malacoplasma iowae 695]WPL36150.1 hypothetical protein QX180_01875 [Malacoplasma iowae]